MLIKTLFVSLISLLLAACSGVWMHPTKPQSQFNVDYAKCHSDSLLIGTAPVTYSGNAVADAYQGVANASFGAASAMNYRNLCIEAAGWRYQSNGQTNDVNDFTNRLKARFNKFDQDRNSLCSNPKFSSYFTKTSCSCQQISFDQKRDQTFATADQLSVMKELFDSHDQVVEDFSSFVLSNGDDNWKTLIIFTNGLKGDLDAARVGLFNRKISWGQYNQQLSQYCTAIRNKQIELGHL